MKPTACPYPFPVMWHRTMAHVMADEAAETVRKHGEFQPNGYGKQTGNAVRDKAGRESVCTAHPGPDQKRPFMEVPG